MGSEIKSEAEKDGRLKTAINHIASFGGLVRDKTSELVGSVKANLRPKEAFSVIIPQAQSLIVGADGCGVCPSCIFTNAAIGVSSVALYFTRNKNKASAIIELPEPIASKNNPLESAHQLYWDGALRCC